ncbi:MAG TPA: AI-2E family transporter [Oculatellaceae cyanobacterium]
MFRWVVLILILLFVYHVREVFPPFVVGGIIAYLLFPLVTYVNRLKRVPGFGWWNPGCTIALIYLLTASVLGVVIYKFGPLLGEQISSVIEHRHELANNFIQQLSDSFGLGLDVNQTSDQVLAAMESGVGKPEEILHVGGMLSHGLLSLLVCIVSSIYFISDSQKVGRFFLRFVPDHNKVTMVNMIGQMNLMLSKYVIGQLILIALMSAVAWSFLTGIFHLKYALLVAILSGFFEIIPVLGPFIAISIAVVVGVSQHGMSCALGIIACYMIARWLEDYLVVPAIIGHAVELHALAVIFAVLVGETMAGALGMLIAIPVAASVKVIIDTFYPPEVHEIHIDHKPNVLALLWNAIAGDKKHSDHTSQRESERTKAATASNSGTNGDGAPKNGDEKHAQIEASKDDESARLDNAGKEDSKVAVQKSDATQDAAKPSQAS